jgi:hypothetical protein
MEFGHQKVPAWRPWWSLALVQAAWLPADMDSRYYKADNHGSVRINRLRKTDNRVFDAAIRPAVLYVALPGHEPLATDYQLWIACDLS